MSLVSIVFKNPARPNDAPSLSFTLADTTIANVKARLHQVLSRTEQTPLSLCSDVTELCRQVYPGEPDPADIKVIFAGQLLKDDALLSAVFESVPNCTFRLRLSTGSLLVGSLRTRSTTLRRSKRSTSSSGRRRRGLRPRV